MIKKAENGGSEVGSSTSASTKSKTSSKAPPTPVEKYVPPHSDFINFKPIDKDQLKNAPVTNYYWGAALDYTELSYKLIKS